MSKRSKRPLFVAALALCLLAATEIGSYAAIRLSHWFIEEDIRTTGDIYAEQSERIRAMFERAAVARELFDFELGWRYRPGYRSQDDAISDQGLRSLRHYDTAKAPDRLRIAAFGDSFVYGSEVGISDAWSSLLEGDGSEFEVLNYGVGGYGTDQALLRYRAEGSVLAPDLVLIGFAPINLRRNVNVYQRFMHNRMSVATKPRFLLREGGGLELLENPIRKLSDWQQVLERPERIRDFGRHDYWYRPSIYESPLHDLSATARLLTLLWLRLDERYFRCNRLVRGGVFNDDSDAFSLQLELLRRFAAEARRDGSDPVVLIFPDRESVERDREGRGRSFDPLTRALVASGIEVWDASEALRGGGSDLDDEFMNGGHYSPEANRRVATWLRGRLGRRNGSGNHGANGATPQAAPVGSHARAVPTGRLEPQPWLRRPPAG